MLYTLRENDKLSKPQSILERDNQYHSVRFRIFDEDDLKVVQEIIKNKAINIK